MKRKHWILLFLFISGSFAFAQNPAKPFSDLITEEGLKEYLSILASDALEGRETGKRGQKMAAAFIKAHFEELGLTGPVNGNYYQAVPLYSSVAGNTYLKVGETTYKNFQDVIYYGGGSIPETSAPVIFAGAGRKEDFDQLEVENKIVLIQTSKDGSARTAINLAMERKAKLAILYYETDESFKEILQQFKTYLSGDQVSLKKPDQGPSNRGVFIVAPSLAAKIMNTTVEKINAAAKPDAKKNSLKKIKPGKVAYAYTTDAKEIKSDNVLGYLEGTDKKDELLVITAHYDHIGISTEGTGDRINNGADDDGSGTVSVMQIAKAFAQAKKDGKGPRRSILFMLVTGEEKGLLGSEFYTQNPVFPLNKTIVNLNIDMVGRRDPQHKESEPYVYVIGSDKLSSELHALSETVNKDNLNLVFDYTYNDQNHPERLYYRSDHWNFAKNNIPIIFYFDGIHEDYHQPSDEVDKIDFDLLTARTKCIFHTAWEIVNRPERIRPDQK